ncbi:MAG TPA: hypothetical protein VFQ61_16680 [Polyangiaceae bacterium]|nr:hypothetical protein [Polyangiaceae bacterium]
MAWNVDEGPVYGLTSQTWQWVAWLAARAFRDYFVLTMRVISAALLLATHAVLLYGTRERDSGLAATYAICSPVCLFMALSGMETPLALFITSVILCLVYGANDSPGVNPTRVRRWSFAIAPLLAVLLYVTRPDALALVLPPLLVERYARTKVLPWRELLIVLLGVGTFLALFKLVYGTVLPLPFYAKTAAFSPYDDHFRALSREVQRIRFGTLAFVALPLVLGALLRRDRMNWTLLATAALFELYHLAGTIDVMGMQGRFYAPALPLLVFAGARGLAGVKAESEAKASWLVPRGYLRCVRLVSYAAGVALLLRFHFVPTADDWFMDQVPPSLIVSCILFGSVLSWPVVTAVRRPLVPAALALGTAIASWNLGKPELLNDDAYLTRHASNVTTYRGLDALVKCLGDSLHIYHSEVGVVGLRFQNGKVTDLAGLLSPRWLFRGSKSFDQLCEEDDPEAIFLPHKNYVTLNREIRGGQCLRNYARVVSRSSSPLYVRKDLLLQYRRCAPGKP